MSDKHLYRFILGIRFFVGEAEQAVRLGLEGGLVVAPSAPLLANLTWDHATRQALTEADLAIVDSGLMVLLWAARTGERLPRVSGLKYLQMLLREAPFREPGRVFWILPDARAQQCNEAWLRARGLPAERSDSYLAPTYGAAIQDEALIELLKAKRPDHIVIGLGGGTQERLGWYLRERLAYRPGVHCVGAAIGFLNGCQAEIPGWADKYFLGWLVRCVYNPRRFVPRYWSAIKLVPMVLWYGRRLPGGSGAGRP